MRSIEALAALLETDDLEGFRTALAELSPVELHAATFQNGDTLLDFALCEGKRDAITALFEAGLDPNRERAGGGTPITFAISQDAPAPVVSALLAAGADPNRGHNGDGISALTLAVDYEQHEVVRVLLAAGADVNETNNGSQTPLITACRRRNAALVRALLDAGAEADLGADGMFPAEAAGDDSEILGLLADARARLPR